MATIADSGSQTKIPNATSAMFGVIKAFGGVTAIGTIFMWLIGHTYSTDILNQYGISPAFIDRPWQSEALLGLQVLPQWVADMVKGNEALVVVLPTAILLLAALTLAKGSALAGGIATVIFGVFAFVAAPVVGHGEAVRYLEELRVIVADCQRSAAYCTSYVKVDSTVIKGVLITADDTKLFVASRDSVTQIKLTDLGSVLSPAPSPPVGPMPGKPAPQGPIAAAPTDLPEPVLAPTAAASPTVAMPTHPMPEDAIITHPSLKLPPALIKQPQSMHAPVPNFMPDKLIAMQAHKKE